MARKKTPKVRATVKALVSSRLREVRQEMFGEHGGPELARRLGLPARTWYNYETGVTVPAEVLLAFIDQTGVNPEWLLSGEGPRYRRGMEDEVLSELTPEQLIRRGLEKLEQRASSPRFHLGEEGDADTLEDFVPIGLVSLHDLATPEVIPQRIQGQVLAYRQWLPNPEQTIGVRLEDDAMHPILPKDSVVAIDRSVTDPHKLQGRIVAACPDGRAVVRWLEISGRHLILRPNRPSTEFPILPVELTPQASNLIVGQVVWSWSRFGGS